MNSSVVQAMELMALPDADALAVTAACEVVIGWAHACLLYTSRCV